MPPYPPPWFPPLESLFRGAPIPMNPQRGKPILPNTNGFFECVGSLLGEPARPTVPGPPYRVTSFVCIFFLVATKRPRGRGYPPARPKPRNDVDWAFPSALKGLPREKEIVEVGGRQE
jgi:hypothetical protein